MKKTILTLLVFITLNQFAQVNLKDYKTIFFQEVTLETDDYKMYLVRCFAREEVLKLKIRIFNKTNDVLFIKPEEFVFVVSGKTLKGIGRTFAVQPNGEEARFIDAVDKGMNMKCENFEVTLNGFYKIPSDGEAHTCANSEWPVKRGSEITAGPVKCTVIDNQMGKEKSFAKYNCSYSGDKICILDPSKSVAIMPKGQENKSTIKKDVFLLENGQTDNITLEFKRLNGAGDLTDGINVKWNETFRVSTAISLKTIKVPMKIDIDKSEK